MISDNSPQTTTTPLDSITIEHAIAWTKNWQKLFPNHCKAFLIPIPDLINLLLELNIITKNKNGTYTIPETNPEDKGVRAYMAIGDSDKDGDIEERLVMVGAIKNKKGVFVDQVAGRKDQLANTLSGSGAFDFTMPCPADCDNDSPLNH